MKTFLALVVGLIVGHFFWDVIRDEAHDLWLDFRTFVKRKLAERRAKKAAK